MLTQAEKLEIIEELAARNLSNYEGAEYNYTGYEDTNLQFVGPAQNSFVNESQNALSFSMKFTNTDANAVDRIALCPGYFTTASLIKDEAGTACAAIVTDGTIIGTANDLNRLVGIAINKPIQEFLDFVKRNPTRVIGIKMLVDNATQFDSVIYVKQNSPFRNLQDSTINPNTFKDETNNDPLRVSIPTQNLQFDDQSTVTTKILAGRTVTYSLYIGGIVNPAASLSNKAVAAQKTITKLSVPKMTGLRS